MKVTYKMIDKQLRVRGIQTGPSRFISGMIRTDNGILTVISMFIPAFGATNEIYSSAETLGEIWCPVRDGHSFF